MEKQEPKPGKLYYSIGEAAQMLGVNASLIRFWEKEFSSIKPNKNKKGNRFYTSSDLDNLRLIYHLVKERGFTLEGAKKYLRENKNAAARNLEIIESLEDIRKLLLEIRESL
jgi:DNA-binding transcriptional MerR regulator